MKNIRLISGLMLAGIALFHNLSAGPISAAKWIRDTQEAGKQTVLLYGDDHASHTGGEENEDRERKAIHDFCEELEKVRDANTKTLVLCEDQKFSPIDKVYSDDDWNTIYPSWKKMFIHNAGCFAHTISQQLGINFISTIQAKSIDPRTIFDQMRDALDYCMEEYVHSDRYMKFKKAYEEIKDWSMAKVFGRAIEKLKFYSCSASDVRAGKIFDEICQTFLLRKKVLWKKILADTGLSSEELDQATVATIERCINNKDKRYVKFYEWVKQHEYAISACYNLEAVEAEALWQIVEMKPTFQKVVVIAGSSHTHNLEKYLSKLEFVQCASEGQCYLDIYKKKIDVRLFCYNQADTAHSLRVSPLDPLDNFGQLLFDKEIKDAMKHLVSLPEADWSEKQRQADCDFDIMQKKLDALKSTSLVSPECFKWINELDSTKKRPREEGLSQQPAAKKKKLNPEDENINTIFF